MFTLALGRTATSNVACLCRRAHYDGGGVDFHTPHPGRGGGEQSERSALWQCRDYGTGNLAEDALHQQTVGRKSPAVETLGSFFVVVEVRRVIVRVHALQMGGCIDALHFFLFYGGGGGSPCTSRDIPP